MADDEEAVGRSEDSLCLIIKLIEANTPESTRDSYPCPPLRVCFPSRLTGANIGPLILTNELPTDHSTHSRGHINLV